MRKRQEKSGKSPYQKYGKAPYHYQFRNCSHRNEVAQSTPDWRGTACSVCNIILKKFDNAHRREAA